jgi:hypothetical protein
MTINIKYTSNNKATSVIVGDSGSGSFGGSYLTKGILIQSAGLNINGSYIPLRFQKSTKEYPKVLYKIGSDKISSILSKDNFNEITLDKPIDIDMWIKKHNAPDTTIEIVASVDSKHISLFPRADDKSLGNIKIPSVYLGKEANIDPSVL